jgi:hypothetical protein
MSFEQLMFMVPPTVQGCGPSSRFATSGKLAFHGVATNSLNREEKVHRGLFYFPENISQK